MLLAAFPPPWAQPAVDRLRQAARWLDGIDPGGRRRVRGLRLIMIFAVASMAGVLAMPGASGIKAGACAGNFAIWASIYEASPTRRRAAASLLALIGASALGAATSAVWAGVVSADGIALPLLPLAGGAFLVAYAKRFGPLGTGVGSMLFIGQTLALGLDMTGGDLPTILGAALLAALSAIGLRILGGPSERDADALSRCRDFRRILAARLRRYHDALHHDDDAGLTRVIPRNLELTTAWADLLTLAQREFTDAELITGYLNTEIRHLFTLLQTIVTIGESLSDLQAAMPGISERAAIGLVLHSLRRVILQDVQTIDHALVQTLQRRCDRLVHRACGPADLSLETRVALLRIGLATRQAMTNDPPPVQNAPRMPTAVRPGGRRMLPTTRVAFQTGLSSLAIILISTVFAMHHVLWALAASTYVISSSVADTWSRGVRRIIGTAVGVTLGLGVALIFAQMPFVIWVLAALAMIAYSVWLPMRYDIACGAYAFALVVTLAEAGHSSWGAASARGMDTVIGAVIGMLFSALVLPVRLRDQLAEMVATMVIATRDRITAALARAVDPADAAHRIEADGANLLAEVAAEKARFAGLRLEGILAHAGDGGAVLLLHIDALVADSLRLVGEARLVTGTVDPVLREAVARLGDQVRLSFDVVLARLRRDNCPSVLPPDLVPPQLHAYLASGDRDASFESGVLLVAALASTSRKVIRTLAGLAAELDRLDAVNTRSQ